VSLRAGCGPTSTPALVTKPENVSSRSSRGNRRVLNGSWACWGARPVREKGRAHGRVEVVVTDVDGGTPQGAQGVHVTFTEGLLAAGGVDLMDRLPGERHPEGK